MDLKLLLYEIRSIFLRSKVLKYLRNDSDRFSREISYLQNSCKLSWISNDYIHEYDKFKPEVFKDRKCGLFYVIDQGRRLYFSERFRLKIHVKRYYKNLCIEQDRRSPHCYVSDDFNVQEGAVLFDVGAAEGIFALRNIDRASEVYLFECDESWTDALEHTFSFCRDKVHIIRKYVGDRNDEKNITLDSIDSSGKSYFLKMDIEGAEIAALKNGMNFISKADNVNIAVCAYHKASHEAEIDELFYGYKIEKSDGYMFFYYDKDFSEPYARNGVMRITVENHRK
jgi:hypothetical protein